MFYAGCDLLGQLVPARTRVPDTNRVQQKYERNNQPVQNQIYYISNLFLYCHVRCLLRYKAPTQDS